MNPLSRRFLVHLLIFAALSSTLPAAEVPSRSAGPRSLVGKIEAILRRSEARRGHWGIEVVHLSGGRVLYSRDAEHLFLPASNMKLFTTAAAVEELGPNFVFRTTDKTNWSFLLELH